MRITCLLFGLSLLLAYVHANPIVKRETEPVELNPLNEIYVVEAEDDRGDEERADRDKRKIAVAKLGVSNGIINFVFNKLDSLIDAKTKALTDLDETNRIKNKAYGIDVNKSATSKFISELVNAKIQSATGSIGPVVSTAQNFFSNTKSGLTNAFVSKLAPLSSIATGLSSPPSTGDSKDNLDTKTSNAISFLGNILNAQLGVLSNSKGLSSDSPFSEGISTTTEDIPEFDRTKVNLDIPPMVFGSGFTTITNISKILSNVITNSARRTQTLLEVFKPFFRGVFAIKGLPSDNPH
ncbi:uncharacterized protein LOC108002752 [Apis cerana]|uniref:uncharacterized protein LOC108002752 n=1 Tax=Apis cerana TaxID=7461 RepID=UPI002B2313AD|nr:uncharacterized protein LOC108002752 [Apis cerana]XP_016920077.2 uncharacterized protein LOC108002752 [Apis cerana]XP_016920078.2 uncharacterized protein LOC108002752 [Apis cerana]